MAGPLSDLHVECYAGYRGDEAPLRFTLAGREHEITDILDRWLAPSHRYFKVRSADGGVFILRQDSETHTWELTLFDSGTREETRLSST